MINKLLRKYRTWKWAKLNRNQVFKQGTLLNAFYKSKTIFIHIPKTAGISLIKAIYGDVTLSGHRSLYFNRIALNIQNDSYFSFSFVRNPFDRLYSTYIFLKKGGVNQHDQRAFDNYLSKFKDFKDFVLHGLDDNLIYQIIHLIPQHEYLCDYNDNILVDFIGKFENLDDDIYLLSKKLKKDIKLTHNNYNKYKYKHYRQVYTELMIEKVSKIYQKDLEIFGYGFI